MRMMKITGKYLKEAFHIDFISSGLFSKCFLDFSRVLHPCIKRLVLDERKEGALAAL